MNPSRILCFLGLHKFQVVDVTYGFGRGGTVSKLRCRRCGYVTIRAG